MSSFKLHFFAVTTDPTISQVLGDFQPSETWNLVIFDDPTLVFSAPTTDLHLLLLDEGTTGSHYMPLVKKARKRFPAIDIVVVGGPKSDDVRLSEKNAGVDYYFERPIEELRLQKVLEHRLRMTSLKSTAGLVGRSLLMEEILEAVLQVAPTEVPILIEGESGTGKDVVAQAVHVASRRSDKPYVAINVASLAEGVLESELFGHEKGAFTGAVAQRQGVFERANGGTIFLDEVGEMSPNMQVRLLRVLESGEVLRVGGIKSFRVDVRVIAATNQHLTSAVARGTFRQDLYYRLKGVNFYLPPLRERREDVSLLVEYFVFEANKKHNKDVKTIDKAALSRLTAYEWPGNVRELRNLVDTLVVLADNRRITEELVNSQLRDAGRGDIDAQLPVALHRSKDEAEREMIYASILALHRDVREIMAILRQGSSRGPLESMKEVYSDDPERREQMQNLSQMERSAIQEALRLNHGNRREAAERLGISERTLYRKIKEYGLV